MVTALVPTNAVPPPQPDRDECRSSANDHSSDLLPAVSCPIGTVVEAMTVILIIVGGLAAMVIVSVLIGTTLDTAAQRRIRRGVADERRRLAIERRELCELRRRADRSGGHR